jgi:hypothetical protein
MLPRLLWRALFVLGGAVLATVAAWLISSASASADTLPVPPATVVDTVANAASDALTSVTAPAKAAVPPPAALPSQAAGGVGRVTGALRTAVSQLGDHVPTKSVVVPALAAQPSTPTAVSTQAGRTQHRSLPRQAAATGMAPASTGAVPVQRSKGRSRAGAAPVAVPAVPVLPVLPVPTPWSPVTVPTAPSGSGGAGAPGGAGIGLVDQTGAYPVPGLDLVQVVPVTSPLGRVTSGRQPGITPD